MMTRSQEFVTLLAIIGAPFAPSKGQPVQGDDDVQHPPFAVADSRYTYLNPRPLLGESSILVVFYNYNPELQQSYPDPIPQFVTGYRLQSTEPFTVYSRDDVYPLLFDDRYPAPFARETLNDWFREASNDRFRIRGDVVAYCTLDLDRWDPALPTYVLREMVEDGCIQCAKDRGLNIDLVRVGSTPEVPSGIQLVGDFDRIVFVGPHSPSLYSYAVPYNVVWLDSLFPVSTLLHELGHLYRFYTSRGQE